jgi:hypothetical protein
MFTPFAFVKSTAAAAPAANLLLDVYPNSAFAHSFRKLRTAYTGNCIQIRKESDNSTQNIGFVNNYIDTASIASFVGAGSAQISIWYDQSGNSIDFTPTGDAGAGFRIVIGGTIQTVNGKVAGYTPNGYQYSMGSTAYSYTGTEYQITTVSQTDAEQNGLNDFGRIFSYKNSGDGQDYNTCNGFIGFYGYDLAADRVAAGQNNVFANSAATAFSANTQYIGWNYKEQNTVGVSLNGGTDATATTGCSSTGLNVNRVRYGTDYLNSDSSLKGYIQEMVTWETYTSGDKSGILSDINTFYATY